MIASACWQYLFELLPCPLDTHPHISSRHRLKGLKKKGTVKVGGAGVSKEQRLRKKKGFGRRRASDEDGFWRKRGFERRGVLKAEGFWKKTNWSKLRQVETSWESNEIVRQLDNHSKIAQKSLDRWRMLESFFIIIKDVNYQFRHIKLNQSSCVRDNGAYKSDIIGLNIMPDKIRWIDK